MRRDPKPKFTDDALTSAYGVAMTTQELAAMLGVQRQVLYYHLNRLGLPPLERVFPPQNGSNRHWRRPSGNDAFRESQLRAAFADGYRTITDVGLELGITRERVRQLCIRYSIERPPKPPKPGCSRCGAPLLNGNKSGLCKVHRTVKRLTYCGWCNAPILLSSTHYNAGMKPHRSNRKGPRIWPFFCSYSHKGHWLADHGGIGHGKEALQVRLQGITRNCAKCGAPFTPTGFAQRLCPLHKYDKQQPWRELPLEVKAPLLAQHAAWYRRKHPNAKPYQPQRTEPPA